MSMTLETCANCGRTIGKLETPCMFKMEVVCAACDKDLRQPVNPKKPATDPALTALSDSNSVAFLRMVGGLSAIVGVFAFCIGVLSVAGNLIGMGIAAVISGILLFAFAELLQRADDATALLSKINDKLEKK